MNLQEERVFLQEKVESYQTELEKNYIKRVELDKEREVLQEQYDKYLEASHANTRLLMNMNNKNKGRD